MKRAAFFIFIFAQLACGAFLFSADSPDSDLKAYTKKVKLLIKSYQFDEAQEQILALKESFPDEDRAEALVRLLETARYKNLKNVKKDMEEVILNR